MASQSTADVDIRDRLVAKRGTKALVWQYFGFDPNEFGTPKNEQLPRCKACLKEVHTKGGNTTNLKSHLATRHPTLKAELDVLENQPAVPESPSTSRNMTLAQSFSRVVKYNRTSTRWKRLTEAVTKCIAKDVLPIYSVEKSGFRDMLACFDSQYDLPSRKYFSNEAIPKMFHELKKDIQKELEDITSFSATSDIWSSVAGMQPYISCTVHFIDANWILKTRSLGVMFMPEDHTGENIANAMTEVLKDWNLKSECLSCITTDSAANMVLAFQTLGWQRLSCFGHNLNLAISKSMKNDQRISRTIGMCHKIVGAFSHSFKKRRSLKEKQGQKNMPQKSLITECETRWGSRFEMVDRLLENDEPVREVLAEDARSVHLVLKWQDVQVLKDLQDVLRPLADFTDLLGGDKYVTASSLFPTLSHLFTSVLQGKETDSTLVKDLRRKIREDLKARYDSPSLVKLMDICTFVDPRYKLEWHQTNEAVRAKAAVHGELRNCYDLVHQPGAPIPAATVSNPTETVTGPSRKRKLTLSEMLSEANQKKRHAANDGQREGKTQEELISEETTKYLAFPTEDGSTDPLLWWKLNGQKFPTIRYLARKTLSICATSVPSERLFSLSGQIVSKRRTLLKPEKVNMLTFLAHNLP